MTREEAEAVIDDIADCEYVDVRSATVVVLDGRFTRQQLEAIVRAMADIDEEPSA